MQTHQKLDRWIERNSLTKSAFADLLGVSRSIVTRWCNGDRVPMRNAATAIEFHTRGSVKAKDWGYTLEGAPGRQAIQKFLLKEGLSVNAAARRIGVATMSLRKWAYGVDPPSEPCLKLLSKALNLKLTKADFI